MSDVDHDFLSIFVQMVPIFLELDKKYYRQKWTIMDKNGQKININFNHFVRFSSNSTTVLLIDCTFVSHDFKGHVLF